LAVHFQPGKWKALALHGLPSLFEERSEVGALKTAHEAQLTALYSEIGRLATQVAWLKKTWLATRIGMIVSRSWSVSSLICRSPFEPTS
jgi:hypothetical protein